MALKDSSRFALTFRARAQVCLTSLWFGDEVPRWTGLARGSFPSSNHAGNFKQTFADRHRSSTGISGVYSLGAGV